MIKTANSRFSIPQPFNSEILALGTIQCPCYTACSTNLMRIIPKKIFAMFNQSNRFFHCLRLIWRWNFCNLKSKSFVQCANCSQEPNNRFFVHKNRNPNVKKGKTENRSGYQNRKTGDFECKNRKTDLKSDQNRKTEKPNAPSVRNKVWRWR